MSLEDLSMPEMGMPAGTEYGTKAAKVETIVIRLLVIQGEMLQGKLINEAAKAVPEIDQNTVNTLVRKLLTRELRETFSVREETTPKRRKFWSLTPGGLSRAYDDGV